MCGSLFLEKRTLTIQERIRLMDSITQSFRATCASLGYCERSASPIFPCPDPTTLFVSATISVLKKELLSRTLNKVFLIQPCLRTQNLRRALEENFDPEYLSSFIMLGILSASKHFSAHKEIPHFFEAFPGLSERILVRSSRAIEDNSFCELAQCYRVEYDTREPRYYRWQYGEMALSGIGLTFALEQPDGTFLDIGNLVQVYRGKSFCAIEFGFGLETFCSRLTGKGSPYAVAPNYLCFELGLSPAEKCLTDCLVVAKKLHEHGVMPGSGKASSVLRKALRSSCFLAIKMFDDCAEEKMNTIVNCKNGHSLWSDLVLKTLSEVQCSVASFRHEVVHMRRHALGSHLEKKKREYRIRYGIPDAFES